MPLNIHAPMQNTHDQHALFFADVRNNMRGVFEASETSCKVRDQAAPRRIFRQRVKTLMQAVEVGLRVSQPEIKDRIFVDSVKVGGSFRGKLINGHRF